MVDRGRLVYPFFSRRTVDRVDSSIPDQPPNGSPRDGRLGHLNMQPPVLHSGATLADERRQMPSRPAGDRPSGENARRKRGLPRGRNLLVRELLSAVAVGFTPSPFPCEPRSVSFMRSNERLYTLIGRHRSLQSAALSRLSRASFRQTATRPLWRAFSPDGRSPAGREGICRRSSAKVAPEWRTGGCIFNWPNRPSRGLPFGG